MLNARRWYSIIIAPHDRTNSWKVRVPAWVLWGLGGFCAVAVMGLIALGVLIGEYRETIRQVELLTVENRELAKANGKVLQLEENLLALGEFHSRIREWVGLPVDTVLSKNGQITGGGPLGTIPPFLVVGSAADANWEWPAMGWISRGFRAASGKDAGHLGIDIVAAKSEPVRAARSGIVVFSGWDARLGNLVIIGHDDGYESRYGHNEDLLVGEGETVVKGQEIGIIGSTGVSSAPHLHFEIRKDGDPIDPMEALTGRD
ncbi:MAG: M23 family metallopeptidase [Candidatus Eisenbacteria sp.]|nr:M23 family metallopeptidase [Candidatus Eisenbacteria bacterium]